MNIKKGFLVTATILIANYIGYAYASDPLQKFRNTVDAMPIEKRIDFYSNAITMLQQIENNPAASKILQTMTEKQNSINNQSKLEEIQYIPKVDYTTLRTNWLERHNTARIKAGITELKNNDKLNKTAQTWANYLTENSIPSGSTHKRNKTDPYYNYNKILNRFEGQNVLFIDTGSTAFSENIGYGYYRACTNDDCTDKLLDATRSTRNFFIEESSRNGPHYRALMSTNFSQIGIGIARNQNTKRYYIVVHYGLQTME